MPFKPRYTDHDFLAVLSYGVPKSTAHIMKSLKCSRNTAKSYLTRLEASGKIRKMEIEGGSYGWKLCNKEA